MTTTTCKDFLAKHADLIGERSDQKWARTKKNTKDGVIFRTFCTPGGRVVTLAERDGSINIAAVSMGNPNTLDENADALVFGKLFVGTRPEPASLVKFLIDCLREDPSNLHNDQNVLAHALDAKNWDQNIQTSPFNIDSNHDLENVIDLPYEGQPADLTYSDMLRIYEFHMPEFDTRYRFPLYLDKHGNVYFGDNNPD